MLWRDRADAEQLLGDVMVVMFCLTPAAIAIAILVAIRMERHLEPPPAAATRPATPESVRTRTRLPPHCHALPAGSARCRRGRAARDNGDHGVISDHTRTTV
jgi:hypothetical protein